MGLIIYVIEQNSSELHYAINKNIKELSDFVFYETDDNDDFKYEAFEGKLFIEEVTIYFDGKISFVKMFIKYTQFLNSKPHHDRVLDFENKLLKLFGSNVNFYRIDELLLEDLAIDKGEFWYRDDEAYKVFYEWIVSQEELHWCKLIPSSSKSQ
ncbi:hypothetical protein [Flavobacterium polysaccharolyticum]|uniref:Uncharacterized protein n=1 Tax=Flavobacterium polysaccharolyticum TaxID=3133148 RepID=A0ABU9NTQ7_9FLAO